MSKDSSYTLICRHPDVEQKIVIPRLKDERYILPEMSCEKLNPEDDCHLFVR